MRIYCFLSLFLTACGFGYKFTPNTNTEILSQSENCEFKISYNKPGIDHEELGIIEWTSGSAAGTIEQFKNAVQKQVCNAGGSLVVINSQTRHGNINTGTVYRKMP